MPERIILLREKIAGKGGAENYLRILLGTLAAQNYPVTLLTDSPGIDFLPQGTTIQNPGKNFFTRHLRSFPLRAEKWCEKNLASRDTVISLDRNLRQHILRAGDGVHAAWLQCRAQAGQKNILHFLRHQSLLRLEKLTYTPERTALVWANSHWVARQIQEHFAYPAEKIHIIHNGVDTKCWQIHQAPATRWPTPIPAGSPVILFAGSGWWRKGWDIAVQIHAEILKKLPTAWLVGTGKAGRESQFRTTLRQKNVAWLGQLHPTQLAESFAGASLFLLPTRYDPFTNVLLEALASGLPVLTSTNNGASEVLQHAHPHCGRALPTSEDPTTWADFALDMLSLGRTPDIRKKCRQIAEKYDTTSHIRQVMQIISLAQNLTPETNPFHVRSKKVKKK